MTYASPAGMVQVGTQVRIERDETRYPSRGSWPQFRGRVGTVVEVNADKRPHLVEYGVSFGRVRPHPTRPGALKHGDVVWFKVHEIAVTASERHAPEVVDPPEVVVPEVSPAELDDILAMAAVPDEVFEAILAEGRASDDLSREYVARKCVEYRR